MNLSSGFGQNASFKIDSIAFAKNINLLDVPEISLLGDENSNLLVTGKFEVNSKFSNEFEGYVVMAGNESNYKIKMLLNMLNMLWISG